MREVDRSEFTLQDDRGNVYEDKPRSIGWGATISTPHMHAVALDALEEKLQPGHRALDVGCGSGYLTTCMARMVRLPALQCKENLSKLLCVVGADPLSPLQVSPSGKATGVDHVSDLVTLSKACTEKSHANLVRDHQIEYLSKQHSSPLLLRMAAQKQVPDHPLLPSRSHGRSPGLQSRRLV